MIVDGLRVRGGLLLVVFAQQVYNKRSQQEELLGSAELSISTFLKNTGQVNDITANLTYGDQYHAGQVCVRVIFVRKTASCSCCQLCLC